VGAGDDHAARIGVAQRGGDPVEDRVVQRVALLGIRDRQPEDAVRRLVVQQLAGNAARP
jgi:hypothetical protein